MGNDRRTVPIAVAESQACKLQQDQQENKNNGNMQIRNQWTSKKQAWTSEQQCRWRTILPIFTVENIAYKKNGRKCIVTGLLSKHLRLWGLLGKHLRLWGLSNGFALCKHLKKFQFSLLGFYIHDWNYASIVPHSWVSFISMVASLFVVCFFQFASKNFQY